MKNIVKVSVISSVILMAGCESTMQTLKENSAEIIGAVTGTVIGNEIGGKYKELWMVAGAVAGAYIASEIKDSLEKEDQENLAAASVQAADTDTATQWENQETGIKGEAKVVANSRNSARRAGLPSEECREIEQTIEKADGSVVKGNMVYCKDADGVWQVAA